MPFASRFDCHVRVVFSRAEGLLTYEDLMAERPRILGHPSYEPDFKQLIDLRAVGGIAISTDEVRELARSDPFAAGSLRAVVVPTDHSFGLARVYELSHASSDYVRAFRCMEDARRWLGLDPEHEPVADDPCHTDGSCP